MLHSRISGTTTVRKSLVYRYFYSTALFGLLIYAIPLAILAFLNIRVVMEMKKAKSHWETLNRKQKREVTASVMPLVSRMHSNSALPNVMKGSARCFIDLNVLGVGVTYILCYVCTAIPNCSSLGSMFFATLRQNCIKK